MRIRSADKPLQGYAKAANAIRLEQSERQCLQELTGNSHLWGEQTTRLTSGRDWISEMINKKNINLVSSVFINCIQIFVLYSLKQNWSLQLLLILICIKKKKKKSNNMIEYISGFILLASLFSFIDVLGLMSDLLGVVCIGILVIYLLCIKRYN